VDRWDADPAPEFSGMIGFYLWGFLVVLAVGLALGGWFTGKARRTPDDLWAYFVAAMLWPLFICAVLFVILWNLLSRNRD
jgi:hypothetical protein